MSCPHFKEGYFGICVAPNAVHVPSIAEMEKFCFKVRYENCPNLEHIEGLDEAEMISRRFDDSTKYRLKQP